MLEATGERQEDRNEEHKPSLTDLSLRWENEQRSSDAGQWVQSFCDRADPTAEQIALRNVTLLPEIMNIFQ